ncbi:MAG: cbb3-type cytochrome c oxidase subunit II, partial [Cyclobacteriaceae bacterium]
RHMLAPSEVSTGSIMPAYPWLYEQVIDKSATAGKISALRTVGVPYEEGYELKATEDLEAQANKIAASLKVDGYEIQSEAEIVALIAYLQRLGTDIKVKSEVAEQK